MKLTFTVGTKAAVRGGYNDSGKRERDVDVSKLSQEDRDLLAAVVNQDGSVGPVFPEGRRTGYYADVVATAPTAEGLVAGVREAVARAAEQAAARRKQEDDELAATEAEDAAVLAERRLRRSLGCIYDQWEPNTGREPNSYTVLNYAKGRDAELATRNSPEWAAWLEEIAAKNAAERAAFEERKAATERAEAARKAAREAEAAAEKGRLAAWVKAHGSELARLRLEDGYDCWVSAGRQEYAEAAAARVVAGLGLESADVPDGYEFDDADERKCPAVAEIKVLRAARAAAATEPADYPVSVELLLAEYKPADDAGGYDDDREPLKQCELRVTVGGLPGGSIDVDFLTPAE